VSRTRTRHCPGHPAPTAGRRGNPGRRACPPRLDQANTGFFVYQLPHLPGEDGTEDTSPRPQFGGLQVDRAAGRGRGYDIDSFAVIGTKTAEKDLDIVSTNPRNGGITLVNREFIVLVFLDAG
jgi:hypothetical protein